VASIILLLGPSNNLLSALLSCVRDTRLFSARGKIDECDGIRNEPPPRDNLGEKNIADHSRHTPSRDRFVVNTVRCLFELDGSDADDAGTRYRG